MSEFLIILRREDSTADFGFVLPDGAWGVTKNDVIEFFIPVNDFGGERCVATFERQDVVGWTQLFNRIEEVSHDERRPDLTGS